MPYSDAAASSFAPLDWRVASPEVHEPLPPAKEHAFLLEEQGIDPQTGISLEEHALAEMEAAGLLKPEEREALLAGRSESELINISEEDALAMVECVMKVAT